MPRVILDLIGKWAGRTRNSRWTSGELSVAGIAHASIDCAGEETEVTSTTIDPQCYLRLVSGVKLRSLPAGWYEFSVNLSGDIVDPVIYLDFGSGFSDDESSRHYLVTRHDPNSDSSCVASFLHTHRVSIEKIPL